VSAVDLGFCVMTMDRTRFHEQIDLIQAKDIFDAWRLE